MPLSKARMKERKRRDRANVKPELVQGVIPEPVKPESNHVKPKVVQPNFPNVKPRVWTEEEVQELGYDPRKFLAAHIKAYPEGFNADGSYRGDYDPDLDPYINPLVRNDKNVRWRER